MATYVSLGELHEKIAYYLAHPEERARIARQGYEQARAHHTYVHRAQQILKHLQSSPSAANLQTVQTTVPTISPPCIASHPAASPPSYPRLVERFAAGDYDAATELGEQLLEAQIRSTPTKPARRLWNKLFRRGAKKRFQGEAETIFNLCGAAFRVGRNDLALRLAHTLLGWYPQHRGATEILGKIAGGDLTYKV